MFAAALSASAQVEMRGGEQAPAGDITAVTEAGVTVGSPGTLIGWDRVRVVRGAMAEKAAPWLDTADAAWRARTRLERGDLIAAEPLFESLFEKSRGQRGPTAVVIAEGLLRCRVRRGAHVGAIDPWLAVVEAGAETPGVSVLHASWASEAGLAPILDSASGLAPSLPPIWVAWPSVEAYARSTPWLGGGGGSRQAVQRVAELATLYHRSAVFESGRAVEWAEPATSDQTVHLIAAIVKARVGNAEQRAGARASLAERLRAGGTPAPPGSAGTPPWLEAWVRSAIGRSLLLEDSPEQQTAGVLELLQLPARFDEVHPYLSGLALAESSVALRKLGDSQGADVLAREFAERYPTHPARDWPVFQVHAPATRADAALKNHPGTLGR